MTDHPALSAQERLKELEEESADSSADEDMPSLSANERLQEKNG